MKFMNIEHTWKSSKLVSALQHFGKGKWMIYLLEKQIFLYRCEARAEHAIFRTNRMLSVFFIKLIV